MAKVSTARPASRLLLGPSRPRGHGSPAPRPPSTPRTARLRCRLRLSLAEALLRQRPIKLMKRPFPKAGTIFQSPEAPLPSSTPSPCSLVGLPPPPLPSPSPASPGPVTRPRVPQILGYREVGQPGSGPQDGGTHGWRGRRESFCIDHEISSLSALPGGVFPHFS